MASRTPRPGSFARIVFDHASRNVWFEVNDMHHDLEKVGWQTGGMERFMVLIHRLYADGLLERRKTAHPLRPHGGIAYQYRRAEHV